MFATLWRWLKGEETITKRTIVRLEDIQTWTDLYGENKQEFVDAPSENEESLKYAEDPEINRKVSIYSGDMTSLEIDGIVRSTDTSLTSSEGISGAIKRAAGPKLDAELKTLGGCHPGEAKTTSGFNLPAKYIVHTVGTKREQPEVLEKCYRSCLEQMRLKNMKSLAFCCISTGLNGYPTDKAVLVALKTVRVWLEELKTENKLDVCYVMLCYDQLDEVDHIIFCLFSEEDDLLYSIWMQFFFPSTYEPEPNPIVTRAQTSSPEEEASAINSGPNSINSEDNGSNQLEQKEQKKLRPLPGFIETTAEPDMITLDDDPNTKRAKMPCGHVMGPDSMTYYFRDILKTGKSKFCCPGKNCNREWEYFLVRHVACLTKEEMRQCEKNLADNFLQKEKGNQKCAGCQTWCTRVPGAGNCVRCPICTAKNGKKFDFCWVCLNEWKRFLPYGSCGNPGCDGKDKRIEILANCPAKRINYCDDCPTIRGCPKCGILIQHQDKCAHVVCTQCHSGFCFICLKGKEDGSWQCRPYFGTCTLAPRQTFLPGSR